jgi:hypothetical protein
VSHPTSKATRELFAAGDALVKAMDAEKGGLFGHELDAYENRALEALIEWTLEFRKLGMQQEEPKRAT